MLFYIEKTSSGTGIIPVEDFGVRQSKSSYVNESGEESLEDVWTVSIDSIDDLIELQERVGCPVMFKETNGGFGDEATALTIVILDD